jgi:hypothetical protein
VGVAHINAGNTTNQVYVLLTLGVIDKLPESLNRVERLFIVMGVEGKDMGPQSFDLLIGLTFVGLRAGRAEALRQSREFMTLCNGTHGSYESLDASQIKTRQAQ